jgi:hypothetical protein
VSGEGFKKKEVEGWSMAAIQLTALTLAEAAHVVSSVWCILVEDDLASPRLAVKEIGDGAVELLFVFGAQEDVDLVMRKLADLPAGAGLNLVESGDAAVESAALAIPGNPLDEPLVHAGHAGSASYRVQQVGDPLTFENQ